NSILSSFLIFLHTSFVHLIFHSFPTRRSSDLILQLTKKTLLIIAREIDCRGSHGSSFLVRELRGQGCMPRKRLSISRTNRVPPRDRKSTRLNSSHRTISYAVFCLKKKKE